MYRPYSQRTAHIHARLLSANLCVKTCTKGWYMCLRTSKQSTIFCLFGEVHPFCARFDAQNGGQETCVYVRYALWIGSIGNLRPFPTMCNIGISHNNILQVQVLITVFQQRLNNIIIYKICIKINAIYIFIYLREYN